MPEWLIIIITVVPVATTVLVCGILVRYVIYSFNCGVTTLTLSHIRAIGNVF